MKKQLALVGIAIILGIGFITGYAVSKSPNIAAGHVAFAATGVAQRPTAAPTAVNVPEALLALRFDNYEAMSVGAYREKAWEQMRKDETTYLALLKNIGAELQGVRYSDENAYFAMNVLVPTIAENWTTWHFNHAAQKDGALTEYTVHYTISDADKVTMGERNRAVSEMMNGIEAIISTSASEQLANEAEMSASLQGAIQGLAAEFSNEAFQIKADFGYRFESPLSTTGPSNGENAVPPDERIGSASQEDYRLLLRSFMVEGYAEMPVNEYEAIVKEAFARENSPLHGAYERVRGDIIRNEIPTALSREECHFLSTSLACTVNEFVAKNQATSIDAACPVIMQFKLDELSLQYNIEYEVLDGMWLTVAERDKRVTAVLQELAGFAEEQSIRFRNEGPTAFSEKISSVCRQHTDGQIRFNGEALHMHTN